MKIKKHNIIRAATSIALCLAFLSPTISLAEPPPPHPPHPPQPYPHPPHPGHPGYWHHPCGPFRAFTRATIRMATITAPAPAAYTTSVAVLPTTTTTTATTTTSCQKVVVSEQYFTDTNTNQTYKKTGYKTVC